MSEASNTGFVYILTSPKTEYVKIGGTGISPMKRVREINITEPYAQFAPWELLDFRQVNNWRAVESGIQYVFRDKQVDAIAGQKELYCTSTYEASQQLEKIEPELCVYRPKIDRMFQDNKFAEFLISLFRLSGLINWLDCQGAWTLTLYTSTGYGRYYTINIGLHEVAFSTYKRNQQINMLYMDNLICSYKECRKWIKRHNGSFQFGSYKSALDDSVSVYFEGGFDTCKEFLKLSGVRRAIVAYWTEALLGLQERNSLSINARHHNYNAVAEITKRIKLEGRQFTI